jgi:hypothetical protein
MPDLSQYTDKELESIANQPDLSSFTDDELIKIAGEELPKLPTLTQNLASIGIGAGTALGAGFGIAKGYKASAIGRNKLAGDLINSIIKPRHREFSFGKNPGQGIAQEGIWGLNINSIGNKVNKRLDELNSYVKGIYSLPENQIKAINLEQMLDPFYDALDKLSKAPETHQAKINEIYGIVKDLEGNIPKGINIKEVPLKTAYGIKKVVEGMQKWNVESTGDQIINSSLKQAYHNIDNAIDTVMPELKPANSRIANLISAKQAIKNRIEVLSRHEPDILDLANLPIKGTVGSTGFKSGLAKILSEKFGLIGKGVKKSVGLLSVFPTIFNAYNWSKDPEPYEKATYETLTGQELSPPGSLEREIELGRVI